MKSGMIRKGTIGRKVFCVLISLTMVFAMTICVDAWNTLSPSFTHG